MRGTRRTLAAWACAAALLAPAAPSHAFQMISDTTIGRSSIGQFQTCTPPFAHWKTRNILWRLNPANQGAGKEPFLISAMNSWTNVPGANHVLSYLGTTSAGWATDDVNTVVWASGNGCTAGCQALTALVLEAGQVIVETDITFNNDLPWSSGGPNDVEGVAAHEFGHTLGIHHSNMNVMPRPTMRLPHLDPDWRTLEADDRAALQCAENTYAPSCAAANAACVWNSDCCSGKCWIKTFPKKCSS